MEAWQQANATKLPAVLPGCQQEEFAFDGCSVSTGCTFCLAGPNAIATGLPTTPMTTRQPRRTIGLSVCCAAQRTHRQTMVVRQASQCARREHRIVSLSPSSRPRYALQLTNYAGYVTTVLPLRPGTRVPTRSTAKLSAPAHTPVPPNAQMQCVNLPWHTRI